MKNLELLIACGIPDKHARTYLSLLELGETTVAALAAHAEIKRTSIYNFIDQLVDQGLIGRVRRNGRWYYRAEPPIKIFQMFQTQIAAFENALPLLSKAFSRNNLKPTVTYFEGPKEVRNIVREELSCKKEAFYIWPAQDSVPMTGGVSFLSTVDRMRIKRGVWVRSIHFRDKRVHFDTSGIGPRFCREVRFAPQNVNITMGVGLYDHGKVGFFSSGGEGFGVLIQSQELFHVMKILFSYFWARCELPTREDV